MQVRCVRAFGYCQPGDVVDVVDGAAVDPEHWEPVSGSPPSPDDPPRPLLPVPPASAVTVTAEEM